MGKGLRFNDGSLALAAAVAWPWRRRLTAVAWPCVTSQYNPGTIFVMCSSYKDLT